MAGGTAALVREYIREEAGLTAPSAALIKAMLINGAKDVGAADIPNGAEGWGHIDLDRTVRPMAGSSMLTTFLDDGPSLRAGYGLLYSFDLDRPRASTSRWHGPTRQAAPPPARPAPA